MKKNTQHLVPFTYLFFLLWSLTAYSQGFQWLQNGGGNNAIDLGNSYFSKEQVIDIVTDSQRNVYVISIISKDGAMIDGNAVTTFETNATNCDFVLASYTCDGTYRWHKIFGGGSTEYPSGVEVDSQDNVYVIGFFAECDVTTDLYYATARIGDTNGIDYTSANTPTSCQRTFLAKFNSNGLFQWIHYPYSPTDNFPYALHPFSSRNFYIVNDNIYWIASIPPGSYEGGAFSNTNTTLPFLYYLLHYDTSGNFISAIPFDLELSGSTSAELRWYRNPYNGYFYAIYLNNTTNAITVTAGGNTLTYDLPKIICFNQLGQYQWHREPSGSQFTFSSIDFDPNNNTYITGSCNNFIPHSFLGWNLPGSNTGVASYLMKCNPDMSSYSWVTNHSPGSSKPGTQILYTPSKIVFTGAINQSVLTWGSQTQVGPGPNNTFDPLLAFFEPSNGDCMSLHRIVGTNTYDDAFTEIHQDAAGDLILGGFMGLDLTDSNTVQHFTSGGNTDFFVTKFATESCQALSTASFEVATIQAFPNPAKAQVQLTIAENYEYTLYNLLGTVVQKGTLTPQENILSINDLSKGCYLLELKNTTSLQRLKILKE